MHNLGKVVKFETVRMMKKPLFWVSAILSPLLMVGVMALSVWNSHRSAEMATAEADVEELLVAVVDRSGMLDMEMLTELGIGTAESREAGIESVRAGELNVFFYVPENLIEMPIGVFSQTDVVSIFDDYTAIIRGLLMGAALEGATENQVVILSGQLSFTTTTFVEGEEVNLLGQMIVPLVILGIFYLLITMFGGQMITSTTEEKENRVTEMILTCTSSKSLIVGKIISAIILGILQLVILLMPMIIGYLVAGNVEIGGVNAREMLPEVVFNSATIAVSVGLMLASYVLFTGVFVMVSVLSPTAKEANNFLGIAVMLMILPLFFLASLMASEPDMMTHIISFFPLTAPIALMTRNALGTLGMVDGMIGMAILVVSGVVVIWLSVKMFQKGALVEISAKNWKRVLNPKSWK